MNAMESAWVVLKESKQHFEHIGTHYGKDVGLLHYPSSVSGEVRSMPFYRRSGSGRGAGGDEKGAGSWKFFHGVTTHPKHTEFHDHEIGAGGHKFTHTPDMGWMIKPQVADHAFEYDHNVGGRYGHSRIKNLSDWMDDNVGDQSFKGHDNMSAEQTNQLLRDRNAWGMHDMAQGISFQQKQQPQQQPQQQQYPANDLRSQGSGQ